MVTRVGINGFGRIGRQSLRAMLERHSDDLEVVAINDITDAETNAHLLRYDSTYGRFSGTVEVVENDLVINGKRLIVFARRDPDQIPWGRWAHRSSSRAPATSPMGPCPALISTAR
jgi:glyceraldehyde 3-phosphate dehydrogenase